jgi:hypothetical protein
MLNWKNRDQAVADEFQDFTTETPNALAAAMRAVEAARGLTSDPSLVDEPPLEIVVALQRPPTPPRFIGQRTWTSRIGSRPKRRGMRVLTSSMMRGTAVSGSSASALKLGARYRSGGWYAPPGVDLSAFGERGWL